MLGSFLSKKRTETDTFVCFIVDIVTSHMGIGCAGDGCGQSQVALGMETNRDIYQQKQNWY